MIKKLFRYLMPPKKLYRPSRHLSSSWEYETMPYEIKVILQAGLARDPNHARSIYKRLLKEHGNEWHKQVLLELYRARGDKFRIRVMKAIRQIFGEQEKPKAWYKTRDITVDANFIFKDNEK